MNTHFYVNTTLRLILQYNIFFNHMRAYIITPYHQVKGKKEGAAELIVMQCNVVTEKV